MDSNVGQHPHEQANMAYAGPLEVSEATSLTAYQTNVEASGGDNVSDGAYTVTLPPVAEARGRIYSVWVRVTANSDTVTVAAYANDQGFTQSPALTNTADFWVGYSTGTRWITIALMIGGVKEPQDT